MTYKIIWAELVDLEIEVEFDRNKAATEIVLSKIVFH